MRREKNTIYLYDDNIGRVELVNHYGNDKMIVNAARVSYGRDSDLPFDERDEKLIRYLLENSHTSPFEHCGVTFKFTVPLFVRSQHHRHRTWSYNEISRRYSSVDLNFYEPESFRTQHKIDHQASNDDSFNPEIEPTFDGLTLPASIAIAAHNTTSIRLYNRLLDKGVCREQARGVLPQSLYTSYYGTVNLHNLFKFIQLRITEHAQYEIRQVARAVMELSSELFPVSVGEFIKERVVEV